MNIDMATLTGAYAVDALGDAERAEFERHLEGCAECTQEVRELRETAARLSALSLTAPPPQLKQWVMREIATTRQQAPLPDAAAPVSIDKVRQRRSWTTRLAVAAAALGIALAGGFGALALHQRTVLDDTQRQLAEGSRRGAEMAEVFSAPDAQLITAGGTGLSATTVVSEQRDKAVFMGTPSSAPPPEHVYQLWFIGEYGYVSAGVMRESGSGGMQPIVASPPPGTRGMGVTTEPAGGSPQPTTDPILRMSMPA